MTGAARVRRMISKFLRAAGEFAGAVVPEIVILFVGAAIIWLVVRFDVPLTTRALLRECQTDTACMQLVGLLTLIATVALAFGLYKMFRSKKRNHNSE